jgi:HSP20 family protein
MTALMKRNGGLSLLPELPSLFSDPILRDWLNWPDTNGQIGTVPAMNIEEGDDAFEISVAAPGLKKDDFKVELKNNQLVISGERNEKNEQKDEGYLRQEYNYQSFVRSFPFEENQVMGDKIQAKYSDGILHITVPKSAQAKTKISKRIPIS